MENALISPANASLFGFPTIVFSILIPLIGLGLFIHIIIKRIAPILDASPSQSIDRIWKRLWATLKYAFFQYRQPRYPLGGIIHILIFAGFVILSVESLTLVFIGIFNNFRIPGMSGSVEHVYWAARDVASSGVLVICIIAMIRRIVFRPARYEVPERFGKNHMGEAIIVLTLISFLMVCDMLFSGAQIAGMPQEARNQILLIPLTGTWIVNEICKGASIETLQAVHLIGFYLHNVIFFSFLCFLPLGKHFHVITSFPNVFLMKLTKGSVKPARWEVKDEDVPDMDSIGVRVLKDFTWKDILDFYSCADCGRCSDQCPANRVGRPLSPRLISIKCRQYIFEHYPIWKKGGQPHGPLMGDVFEEDEIWSCTTCGACQEECPLTINYIDKIVDLRRGMIEEGLVPQPVQKALGSLEKRGNPYGKLQKRRSEWIKELPGEWDVKILSNGATADTLYFVDSITSYDDRMRRIALATALVLHTLGIDFGILGSLESDSGHEVRRFGEEMLFLKLRSENLDAIQSSGATRIVTADPHAFNALKNDYHLDGVQHISQVMAKAVSQGKIRLKALEDQDTVITYHDSCYLGRHNGIYDAPRAVIDAIPSARRVEMKQYGSRSFCCGGGGLHLYLEPPEKKRMGTLRVEMAKDAGATIIVTACPYCLTHMEDSIKTLGLEKELRCMDLVELLEQQMV